MRTGAAAECRGYYHEAAYYGSDEELLAITLPFLIDGVAAGEPTIVAFGERHAGLVRDALGAAGRDGVDFLAGGPVYARPAAAIRSYQQLLAGHVTAGASQIRIIGELPQPSLGATWDWWARYESAINHAYDDFPLWSMCAYDTRIAPAHVLDDVARTHPHVATADGRHADGEWYMVPETFLSASRPLVIDPVQGTPPIIELVDPLPTAARQAVLDANLAGLPPEDIADLQIAVSEIVTNALFYGQPPVRVRFWGGADRIVVSVHDGGAGPTDPYAGLLPRRTGSPGGLGLWLAFQLCDHVTFTRDEDGFTLRLTAGNPNDEA